MYQSFKAGEAITCLSSKSAAAGLAPPMAGLQNFKMKT